MDWDDSKYLEAEPGDYVIVARKAKNRKDEWFLGAITDENPRKSAVALNFLDPKQKYVATIYADAADAHYEKNPMAYTIEKFIVSSKTVLKLQLAPGGGAAVSITPATKEDKKKLKQYKR